MESSGIVSRMNDCWAIKKCLSCTLNYIRKSEAGMETWGKQSCEQPEITVKKKFYWTFKWVISYDKMTDDDQYAVTKYHYYIKISILSTQNHPNSLICHYLMTPPLEDCVKWVKRVKCITQLNNEQCFFMKSEHPSILFSLSLSGLRGGVL